jgi:cellobiose phosphorylase
MKFGYFDDQAREYVITDPRTPVKWINYIGTLQFGGFVDHTGGTLLCSRDPALNRITKYITQMPSSDFKGETLYLRLHTTSGYRVFSPFFVPTLDQYDRFECRVGLGYTRIISEFYGIQTEVVIFIPDGGTTELRDVRVTNISRQPIRVDAIPVAEYTHPNSLQQLTNADWVPQTMTSVARQVDERTVLLQYPFMLRDTRVNYFTANISASSFETDRKRFLGANEYGTWVHPFALDEKELGNYEARRGDNIGALLLPLGELKPGETRRFVTLLGQAASLEEAEPVIRKMSDFKEVDAAFESIHAFYEEYLSALQVQTPDTDFDRMINVYNPRQCWITLNWSRYLSYYQLGYGARGIGFRDSSQDVMGVLSSAPQAGKELMRKLLSVQKRNGSAMHQFNPLTMEGALGEADAEDRPHYYSDDHLWIILAVIAYLKETGDRAFLNEAIPFYEKDGDEIPLESGSVLEHLKRGLTFTQRDTGAHGLPLLGFADWNDTINLPAGAESLFTTHLYGRALTEMIALCESLGDQAQVQQYRQDYETMRSRFEQVAWDGDWYVMYFDHDGSPVGSQKNEKGKIHLNGQTWPVLSGFAAPERARMAMDAVRKHLNTRYGIKLSAPGYDGFDPNIGGITTYPPGAKENGGIFLHPNPWAIIAETLLGNGDRAYEYYAQINPAAKNDMMEIYECEPYVYPQNVLADEHPQFGMARNTWLSGTSSWTYQAATQWILGVRAEYDGLRVDPCIPSTWEGFSMARRFRGSLIRITVHNPQKVCRGVARMTLDSKEINGNIIPIQPAGGEHVVEVWLGKQE